MKTKLVTLSALLALSACNNAATPADDASPSALASAPAASVAAMAIGDDSGTYANDRECDDPRFVGAGMASGLLTDNIGRDATDCQAALDAGTISPNTLFDTPASDAEIVYGDDSGQFVNDGECDDIRFTGDYASSMIYIVEDIGHDATDCRNAVQSGAARWQGNTATPMRGMDSK